MLSRARLIGLVIAALFVGLTLGIASCSDRATPVTLTPTLTPTKTATLTPTSTPTPVPTPTPTVGPQNSSFSGDYITQENGSTCLGELSPEAFMLGGVPYSCNPGEQGGTVIFSLPAPQPDDTHVFVLRIVCPGTGGCASAVDAQQAGTLSVSVDGQVLWTATCAEDGSCDALALGKSPAIAFRNNNLRQHQVRLETSPGLSWTIERLEAEWIEIPGLIQGVAYSPFRDCQNPHTGPFPTEMEIREDLALVRHMGNAIRTYSSTDIQRSIPIWAQEAGLRVSAGAWLGPDMDANEEEIANLIELAHTMDLESVIVGNEVLLRGDLTEEQLVDYIQRVKNSIPGNIPVTTAEIGGIFLDHPNVIEAVDYMLVHIYAYWDGQPIEGAARYVVDEYHSIQAASEGKRVVIGETGWPSNGPANRAAVPSFENQRRFLREFVTLAQQESVEFYYFATFDELWKTEGGVGPYWGIFYPDRRNKYDLQSMLIPLSEQPQSASTVEPLTTPTADSAADAAFYVYLNYGAEENKFAPSGWMGDVSAIRLDDCFQWGDDWADRAVRAQYIPSPEDKEGWAGVYWQYPENNWGTMSKGHDLQGYAQLRFRAKSDRDGDQVKFLVGGVYSDTFAYPSSIPEQLYVRGSDSEGFVTLGTEWQEFHIDLLGADLSHVIDGFGWVAERKRSPDGTTFYLDDIQFDTEPFPPLTSTPTPIPIAVSPHPIYVGATLSPGYDMGVDTSRRHTNWVADMNGYMCMFYPVGQSWGAVFITVGRPTNFDRPGRDLSSYQTLSLELQGAVGGEQVWIGLKDNTDPDNGRETKILASGLTTEWQTFTFPLSSFHTARLDRLYVVTEFVFESGTPAEIVCFRNIQYLP